MHQNKKDIGSKNSKTFLILQKQSCFVGFCKDTLDIG